MGEIKSIEADRVAHVDFAAARRARGLGKCSEPAGDAPRAGRDVGANEATMHALAQLIAENAEAGTLDRDLASICRLLGERCGWSASALTRLRRAAGAAHAMRLQRGAVLADGRGEQSCGVTAMDCGRRPAAGAR